MVHKKHQQVDFCSQKKKSPQKCQWMGKEPGKGMGMGSGWQRMEGESTERNSWNLGASLG